MGGTKKSFLGKHPFAATLVFVVIFLFAFIYYQNGDFQGSVIQEFNDSKETITVASWNLQVFGDKKASDEHVMNMYRTTLEQYDISFIQEIRDTDSSAFYDLCNKLEEYECIVSSRAGRSSSKEQYGVFYKEGIVLEGINDLNPDESDRWERPPLKVSFTIDGTTKTFYTIHTKPDDVKNELVALEDVTSKEAGEVIILGDLNADCRYYDPRKEPEFNAWHWIIPDEADTTTAGTDCAYDRIIMSDTAFENYVSYGIEENNDQGISDHYLIWTEIKK